MATRRQPAAPAPTRPPSDGGTASCPEAFEEALDGPGLSSAERDRALRDLDWINRLLLGNLALLRAFGPRLAAHRSDRPLRVLDIGAGSGEVARQLAAWVRHQGGEIEVVALDAQLGHLGLGRRRVPLAGRVAGMADRLPFPDAAFDWSFSSLFFHHLDAAANRQVLAEMLRVSRVGAVVVDLRAGWTTRALASILLRLLPLGPIARGDGLVSVRRAWSLDRVARVTEGLPVRELRCRFPCRFSLVLEKNASGEACRSRPIGQE